QRRPVLWKWEIPGVEAAEQAMQSVVARGDRFAHSADGRDVVDGAKRLDTLAPKRDCLPWRLRLVAELAKPVRLERNEVAGEQQKPGGSVRPGVRQRRGEPA